MAHDPYRTPGSRVEDPPIQVRPRPPRVTLACWILWTAMAINFATLHPWIRGEWWDVQDPGRPVYLVVAHTGTAFLFYGAFVVFINRGHNWARWGMLVFQAGTALSVANSFVYSLSVAPLAATIDALTTLAEFLALYLLF